MKEQGNDENDITVVNPENVLDTKRILGIRPRNIVEGIIFAAIAFFIILQIPFVTRIKIIFIIVICFSLFILSCIGIKDNSATEIIINLIDNSRVPKIFHLRSIDNAKRRKNTKFTQENLHASQSIAEKIAVFVKEKYTEYQQQK